MVRTIGAATVTALAMMAAACGSADSAGSESVSPDSPPQAQANEVEALPPVPEGEELVEMRGDQEPEVVPASGDANELKYSWDFKIPNGHLLLLKAFKCPSDMPNVKTNGTYRSVKRDPNLKAWHVADMTATASEGVGYHGFSRVTSTANAEGMQIMNGWPEGDLLQNSIWAPVFQDGTFKFSVTCTSSTALTDVAYALPGYGTSSLVPWGE